MPDVAIDEPSPLPARAIIEPAEIFLIGDSIVNLLPSRFVDTEPIREGRGWIEVRTKDAVLRVGPKRRAWID